MGHKSFQNFEEYLISKFQTEEEEEGKRKGKRQKVDTRKPLPEAYHELWDDDEPTSAMVESGVTFPIELGVLGEITGV